MRVLLAGGGTAGHINPALAIAKHIRSHRPDAEIAFVGTKEGIESDLIPKEGFPIFYIDVRGFKRKLSLYNLGAARRAFTSLFQAGKIIKEFRPDIAIGTGGYVSGPVIFVAAKKKIPTLIHESNVFPGETSRMLSKVCDEVLLAFEDARQYFPKDAKTFLVGNPLRDEIVMSNREKSREQLGIGKDEKFVVSFAGSLGAREINKAIINMLPRIKSDGDIRYLHATGDRGWQWAPQLAKEVGLSEQDERVKIVRYIYNMPAVMAAADLVVSRSGALTLSELAACAKPSILIPSPNVTHNHQEINARSFEKAGASRVMLEHDMTSQKIYEMIRSILSDPQELINMSRNAQKLAVYDSCDKIYDRILELLG